MVDVVETSFETGGDDNAIEGDINNVDYTVAWQFTLGGTVTISAGSFYVNSVDGTPSGDITITIETDVSDLPSGTLVHASATGVILNGDVSLAVWNKRTFTPFSLAAGTYWIVLVIDAQATNVRWNINRDANGVGRCAYSNDLGSSWTGYDDEFMPYMRVYRVSAWEVNVHDCSDLEDKMGG